MDNLKVTCYSGHTCAERPMSFLRQGIEYKVEEIEEAWQEPGKRLFKVVAQDRTLFALCYNEATDRWAVAKLV